MKSSKRLRKPLVLTVGKKKKGSVSWNAAFLGFWCVLLALMAFAVWFLLDIVNKRDNHSANSHQTVSRIEAQQTAAFHHPNLPTEFQEGLSSVKRRDTDSVSFFEESDSSVNGALAEWWPPKDESYSQWALPCLVGLGAEKSGSTSLGDALFQSQLFFCPKREGKDTETRFWGECLPSANQSANARNALVQAAFGQNAKCNLKNYAQFGEWKRAGVGQRNNAEGKCKYEKSVDYLGLRFVADVMVRHLMRGAQTRVFVMVRFPPPRIQSTYYFFVGNERTKLPQAYGTVDAFTRHMLSNDALHKVRNLLLADGNSKDASNAKSKNSDSFFLGEFANVKWAKVFEAWDSFMATLLADCLKESTIAGFPQRLCNAPQLLRRAVGLSCYIVPVMHYFQTAEYRTFAEKQLRVIQTEQYFENPKGIVKALLCWQKYGYNDCDDAVLQRGLDKVKVRKLTSTNRKKIEMSDETLAEMDSFFRPCHLRLKQLFELYPTVALTPFQWDRWYL